MFIINLMLGTTPIYILKTVSNIYICSGLNRNEPHRLIDLNAWLGKCHYLTRIRKCGLFGGSMSLKVALGFQMLKSGPVSFSLPAAYGS